MATDPTPAPAPASPTPPPKAPSPPSRPVDKGFWARTKPGELVVFHHSPLFYWWPVWFLGFVLALLTYIENRHMAIVPDGTVAASNRQVEVEEGDMQVRDVLILPAKKGHLTHKNVDGKEVIDQPYILVSHKKGYGTLFIAVLLLVITITNVPMRGLWSVFIIMLLVMLSIIFGVAGWWDEIFARVRVLATHINLSGYILLSTILFVIWVFNFFIMDRQTYIVFTPGQVRVRLEIGGGETVYDTVGMVVQKQRADLFRHWILGFGSGDMLVRPAGMQHPIELPNVLQVGKVVKQIEGMVKEKVVVSGN